eukprot:452029_1
MSHLHFLNMYMSTEGCFTSCLMNSLPVHDIRVTIYRYSGDFFLNIFELKCDNTNWNQLKHTIVKSRNNFNFKTINISSQKEFAMSFKPIIELPNIESNKEIFLSINKDDYIDSTHHSCLLTAYNKIRLNKLKLYMFIHYAVKEIIEKDYYDDEYPWKGYHKTWIETNKVETGWITLQKGDRYKFYKHKTSLNVINLFPVYATNNMYWYLEFQCFLEKNIKKYYGKQHFVRRIHVIAPASIHFVKSINKLERNHK